MNRSYVYRLYPNKIQADKMSEQLETHRILYNNALFERKDAWDKNKRRVTFCEQSANIKNIRPLNEFMQRTNYTACTATLRRLDRAFQSFFRRVKSGESPGYPRFKGKDRWSSIEFPKYGNGVKIRGDKVYFYGIGDVRVLWHRKIPSCAIIKNVILKNMPDGWCVVFTVELPDALVPCVNDNIVGIDVGLKTFLSTSDGSTVYCPKYYQKARRRLRRAQRALSRCQRGSKRREKAKQRVARLHQKVARQRRDFHFKTSLSLVRQYGFIAHENLNVHGLARTRLAKSIHDAAWSQFLTVLGHKAEEAGVTIVAVDPRNTTQACSSCGAFPEHPLTLRDRTYVCAHCGHTEDRDVNAAKNILLRARVAPADANVTQ